MTKTTLMLCIAVVCMTAMSAASEPVFTWEAAAKLPTGKAGGVRGIVGGKVLMAGGSYWPEPDKKVWTGELDVYDIETDRWEKGPTFPAPFAYAAGGVINGRLYAASGTDGERDYTKTIICLRFAGKYQWIRGPALPAPRIYAASAIIGTKLYISGGSPDHEIEGKLYRDTLVLDTARLHEGWKTLRRMPGTGRCLMAAEAIGDKIYMFGGYLRTEDGMANSDDAFVYDTTKNRWRRLPDAPYASRGSDAIGVDGQVYILGGYVTWPAALGRDESFTDNILRFDPQEQTYTDAGTLPLPVIGISPLLLEDGSVFIAGGEDRMRHRTDVVAIGRVE